MTKNLISRSLNRRDFIKLGGSLLGAASGSLLLSKALLKPEEVVKAERVGLPMRGPDPASLAQAPATRHFIATDGWCYLPPNGAVASPFHPDDMAPVPFNTYMFGFRDMTDIADPALINAQKMKCQTCAPLWWLDEWVTVDDDVILRLTNLGLQLRPDLVDSHTLHFHGFRNAIPIFDGEPHSSVAVPIIRDLTYFYRAHNPGTYMYHCHFEETEHMHMGMTGPVFIRPMQNRGFGKDPVTGLPVPGLFPLGKYTYNDGLQPVDLQSTRYDREYVMTLTEVWSFAHWCDSHIQLPEWTDFKPDFWLLNGRSYPDTLLEPGLGTDPATGDLIIRTGQEHLQYQPISSLVTANPGERVLLRFINLTFQDQTMTITGFPMRVVGKDAVLLRGRDGTDLTYWTNTVAIDPGETVDAIFTAPAYQGPGPYDRYLLYNRNLARLNNNGAANLGGQATEIRVYPATAPANTLAPQVNANDWPTFMA
jgi:hypothetical protein